MRFTIVPFALVDISISVRHSTDSVKNSIFGHSLKLGLILKYDSSEASPFYPGC